MKRNFKILFSGCIFLLAMCLQIPNGEAQGLRIKNSISQKSQKKLLAQKRAIKRKALLASRGFFNPLLRGSQGNTQLSNNGGANTLLTSNPPVRCSTITYGLQGNGLVINSPRTPEHGYAYPGTAVINASCAGLATDAAAGANAHCESYGCSNGAFLKGIRLLALSIYEELDQVLFTPACRAEYVCK